MRPPLRSRLGHFADALLPWAVGGFLALVAGGEEPQLPGIDLGKELAIALAIVQGAALHWRQASAADDVFETRPDQARAALRSIEQAGRDALRELRTLLGGESPGGPDPTHPQPGLARLDELAEPLRLGGLDVVVRREGEAPELPAGVDLSAYRIVQEALTNTLRHARATRAEVTVRYHDRAVELEVRDDGRGSPGALLNGAGQGLVGMRERAALLGGTLEAGPLPGSGYDVDEYVFSALRAGAGGFLLKDVRPPELTEAIRVVARGDALLAPGVTRRLLDRFAGVLPDDSARPADLDELTEREVEVLRFVALAPLQRRDRLAARADRGDREDARLLCAAEAWAARPRAGRGVRVQRRARSAALILK